MEPQKKKFKPQSLRTLLSTLFFILLLGGGAGFYFGISTIRAYAVEVNNRLADADASGKQIEQLQALRERLSQSTSLIEKADLLFATPASYQSQALTDLKRYADSTGLSITNTAFSDPAENGVYSVTITLQQPVTYNSLVTFLSNVESNVPKMQVSSIELGPAGSGGAARVKTGDIKIDISVR